MQARYDRAGYEGVAMGERKTIVVTGASDGIGAAAAKILVEHGHRVIVVGRSPQKTQAVAEQAQADHFFVADFSRLEEVGRLADDLRRTCPQIDVLANNAGGIFDGPVITEDGFERTFQVNHLAPFLLTNELMDILLDCQASVVNTSSVAARMFGDIDLCNLDGREQYTPRKAYGTSKLANILFTKELHYRYHDQGLSSVAFHPGVVATNFSAGSRSAFNVLYHTFLKVFMTSAKQGGRTLTFFIEGQPNADWVSGAFYHVRHRVSHISAQASDSDLAHMLWKRSVAMVGCL